MTSATEITPRALLRPVRVRVAVATAVQTVAAALWAAPGIAVVEIARELLDGPREPDHGRIWLLAGIAAALLALRLVLIVIGALISHLADADLALHLRTALARRLAVVPLGWFGAPNASARVKRAVQDDVAALHHAVAHARGDLGAAIAGPLVIVAYLLWSDWRLALLMLALVAGAQATRMRLTRKIIDASSRLAVARTELGASAIEFVHGISVVKTFGDSSAAGAGAPAHGRFDDAARTYVDVEQSMLEAFVRPRALARTLVSPTAVLLVCCAAGCGLVAAGTTRPVDVVAFALLGLGLFELLTPVYAARAQVQAAASAHGRIAEVLTVAPLPVAEPPRALPAYSGAPLVELDDVRFAYDARREVLCGVTARLAPGTVTALVGPSGAGKSTVGQLLARFHDVTGGAIRIGGVDLRELSAQELYRTVGFVFQEVTLLRASLRDNIALARPDASDEQIRAAAQAAQIHERIEALERGYDAVIGEDALLSGGERQRISIARTLLADTPVLVLDEATAFADPESEAAVQDALSQLVLGRTLLVIAHRLHTVVAADQILVLEDGRVVERGRHDALLAAHGRYAALWAAQESTGAGMRAGPRIVRRSP